MSLSIFLAVLGSAITAPAVGQSANATPARSFEDLRRFDNETLVKAWGRDNCLTGSAPETPRPGPPAPIRPTDFLVVDADGPDANVWGAFVWRQILDRNRSAPIEGSNGPVGEAKWRHARMPEHGELIGAFRFAYVTVRSEHREVWMARLPGASALFVNGDGFVGDPERRGFLGVPIELRAGDNQVFVAGIRGGFELELWKPSTRIVLGTWDVGHPALERTSVNDISADLVLPVFNASSETAVALHHHYGHARCDDGNFVPRLTDWADGGVLAPLGMLKKSSYMFGFDEDEEVRSDCKGVLIPLCAHDATDADADRRVVCLPMGSAGTRPTVVPSWGGLMTSEESILVYGTKGTEEDNATSLALARYVQQRLWYSCNLCPAVLSDDQFASPRNPESVHGAVSAFLFGDARTNAVTASLSAPFDVSAVDETPLLRLTAPIREKPARARPPIGLFSAPDARTMRLLYAIEPFVSLPADAKQLAFAAGDTPTAAVIRRK